MKKAEITCVSPALKVEDLDLKLIKGQVVYVGEAAARGSKDLECLRKAGGVAVRFLQRCRVLRPAQQTPKPLEAIYPPRPQKVVPLVQPPAPTVDIDALAIKVANLLRPILEANQRNMEQAVRKVLGTFPTSTPGTVPVRQPEQEEKVFIPDVEFSGNMHGEILMEEGESRGGTVDEAAAALRKVRATAKRGNQ